jgi:hypothetical protein
MKRGLILINLTTRARNLQRTQRPRSTTVNASAARPVLRTNGIVYASRRVSGTAEDEMPGQVLGRLGGVMRKQFVKASGVALATALMAFATATTARANDRITAKVPFAFIVGDSRLPAGEYIVETVSDDLSIWAIASVDGRRFALISTIPTTASPTPTTPELVFDKFDNQYFLARVVADNDDVREIPLTSAKMEHEVIKLTLKR